MVQKSCTKGELDDQRHSVTSHLFRIAKSFTATSLKIKEGIADIISARKIDDSSREELEDLLIRSDMGAEVSQRIVGALIGKRYTKDVSIKCVLTDISAQISEILSTVSKPFPTDFVHRPHVILVVGVNGVGKTAAIGKLSKKISDAGLKVMLAAGDTFRSAAVEQLKIWADRTSSDFVGSKIGSDAAALVYEAMKQAKMKNIDVLIIDTAGRIHNNVALMAEIGKIVRILKSLDNDAPHSVLQVLDATIGQNSLRQVEMFRDVAKVNGLIMTKLDGTARGGALVSIATKYHLPVYFIGVGEGIEDLAPFVAKDFADAIVGISCHDKEEV
ncbi:MAG: signal recognition particle-docking protein FtsY [Candidatus Liberibacter europaeus]|uniref:Signal recognition particle receptor FtsY n=1 Tax=Candidatus Liberibacter europaeus TaxID=744859 RepID=A0A2T4VYI7_9HYPH|nr:signal recognition particle-docking protein FtsY [Candidatus Liberibacter europaeus]PTL86830.1 MAG: signal recognition particle-docking protein FtsY [Candidatus Liberibacter europaeus]